MFWEITTAVLALLVVFWIILTVRYKLQLIKLRRKYNAEENKSRSGAEPETPGRVEPSDSPERNIERDVESKGRSLFQNEDVGEDGSDNRIHKQPGTRRRRIFRRKK